MTRFSKLPDGRVLDSEPMKAGDPLLVFDKTSRKWVEFEGTLGDWRHSIAITAADVARLTRQCPVYTPTKIHHTKSKTQVSVSQPRARNP